VKDKKKDIIVNEDEEYKSADFSRFPSLRPAFGKTGI